MGRNTKLAAIFGHPTELRAYTRYTLDPKAPEPASPGQDALEWMPGQLDVDPDPPSKLVRKRTTETPSIVKNRWVYVFTVRTAASKEISTHWTMELWTDGSGNIAINPYNRLSDRLGWTPSEASPEAKFGNELPVSTPTSRLDYILIGTPFRLTNECLKNLCDGNKIVGWVPPVDPREYRRHLYYYEHGHKIPTPPFVALPVVLPFDVARNLNATIGFYRSLRQTQMGLEGPNGRPTKSRVEKAKEYTFTKSLLAIATHPELESKLEDALEDGSLDRMNEVVRRQEAQLAKYDKLAEGTAIDLCRWLARGLVRALLDGCIPQDEAELIVALDESLGFLPDSGAGLQWLPKFFDLDSAPEIVRRYFLGTKALEGLELAIVRECGKSFLNIFNVRLHLAAYHNAANIANVLNHLGYATGQSKISWFNEAFELRRKQFEFVRLHYPVPAGKPAANTLTAKVVGVAADLDALKKLEKQLKVGDFAIHILDSLNFALAVRSYLDVPEMQAGLKDRKRIDALTAGTDLFASILNMTFDAVGRQSVAMSARVAVRGLGFLAGVVTAVLAWHDGNDLMDRGDTDAAVAMYVSSGLSLLSAISLFLAAAVSSSVWFGPVGWAAGVLAALVYAIHLALRDDDIKILVAHTRYGSQMHKASEGWLPWCRYPLNELSSSWDRQIEALERLRRQYGLGFGERVRLRGHVTSFHRARIYVGGVDDGTSFRVRWTWTAISGIEGEHEEMWTLQPAVAGRGDVERRSFGGRLIANAEGALYFDLEAPEQAWRDGNLFGSGPYGFRSLRVEVHQTFETITRTKYRIPDESALELAVKDGHKMPDTDHLVLSVLVR